MMCIKNILKGILLVLLPFSIAAYKVNLDGAYNVIKGIEGFRFTIFIDSEFEYYYVDKGTMGTNGKGFCLIN